MYLPASTFTACCSAKWPNNTLFPDVSATSVGFEELTTYLPLVLALYELSPMGSWIWIYNNKAAFITCLSGNCWFVHS